ncbi:hypothetical protein [Pantoea anthophila]|uniref:hypothetical protein n=1 Tax=Pantoea anthophila TaxID=470931 RepID=UPI000614DB80|nr:hypothetical protein [Pantoea anthophila]KKB03071.1 hypothetical protein TN98_18950 [Pantoea anthophila]
MYFSSDEKANVIIGEAAMNLFTAGQEVNVELLINELQVMANSEVNEIRLEKLKCARQWLMGFKTIGSRGNAPANWLSRSFGKESTIPAPADDIVIKH